MQGDDSIFARQPEDTRRHADEAERRRDLPPAAQRALAEAEARRAARRQETRPVEIGGPEGPEPVRYGDWEIKGRASDF